MSKKHSTTRWHSLPVTILGLGTLAVVSSFALGLKTAGNIQTVAPMEASGTRLTGDISEDGIIDVRDAITILEIANGYRDATPDELLADPNGDGALTIDDAIRILNDIAVR
ncbi:hypothetical protein K8942_02790 [Candidatus Peribacteria bacterium]|nr:MAG: hypothetical protein K8942_02790 [Candidatus Peribacteria bacterium]